MARTVCNTQARQEADASRYDARRRRNLRRTARAVKGQHFHTKHGQAAAEVAR